MNFSGYLLPVQSWGPLRLPESVRRPGDTATGPTSAPRPSRILIVEDDAALAAMYRVRLERDGHEVAVAVDGETALVSLEREGFDVVLLDIGLPSIDGLEVLRAVRSDAALSQVPVVILSNYSEPQMVERGLELGAVEYLVKAEVTPGELAARIPRWRRG